MEWAWDQRTGSLAGKAVLITLAAEWDLKGACRLSALKIAQRVDTDPSTAQRILDRLRERGLISWTAGAGRAPNTYVLSMVESPRSNRSHR